MLILFGQGYYIARPNSKFQDISFFLKKDIKKLFNNSNLYYRPSVFGKIGELGSISTTTYYNKPSISQYELFKKNPNLGEIFVLDEQNIVCGILTRKHVFEKYGGEFGYNLSRKISVEEMMLTNVLTVDENSSIDHVAELAMQRDFDCVYDAIAITRDGKYLKTITVRELLLTSVQLQVSRAIDANPLTGLPGNHEIQRVIKDTYKKISPWSIIYFDLDNFKAYNDAYGFTNGDLMLKALANTLQSCVEEDSFLGHIGGDDFVMITNTCDIKSICVSIIETFKKYIETLYSKSDWKQGFILSNDRSGFPRKYPIASISISVLTNQNYQPSNLEELASKIATIKKECKKEKGNTIIIH